LEKKLALNAAAKNKKNAPAVATVEQDRPKLPVEVRSAPQLQSEHDLPDSYGPGQLMGVNDEGIEIIYVGEAASDKVIKIPPNHYVSDPERSAPARSETSSDDHLYDDEPARPAARRSAARERLALEPVPVVGDTLSVTSGVPTIDSQLRQARQPLPLPRVRTRRFGDPRAEYHRYYEALRAGNHSYALTGFRNFVERFPTHEFADNAQYWIGETFYDQKRFKSALLEFRKVVDNHPAGNKVPDGLLKLGYCYHELGELSKAKQVWQQVVQLYPKSNPATLARTKLQLIED
jgi:tol-pal system protein YbgF